MDRILTSQLPDHADEQVTLEGWLHRKRELSKVHFLVLRDRAGVAQIVVGNAQLMEQTAQLDSETVIAVTGTAKATPQAPGGVEVLADRIEVISAPAELPPIELHRPELKESLPTILDNAPVALRHPRERAKFRLSAAAMRGFRESLTNEGFTEIQTPRIVGGATESGANVFKVDYFGREGFLAQSPQLYKQIAVGIFERVFEVGPVFRAEPHDTPRHLAEYVSLDLEVGFIEDHHTVMDFARLAIAGMAESIRTNAASEVELLGIDVPDVPEKIPVVDFPEAQQMVQDATGEQVVGEPDLAPAHERWLGEWAKKEHGSEFVFVSGYPMAKRPFYTHPDPERPEFSNSFDLLFRGLELITGGQRLHLYQDYLDALSRAGQDPAPLEGYLQTFKYGMPPHGGFAIGLERWISRLVEAANIRETTFFPRDITRISP